MTLLLEHISPYVVLVIDDNPYGLMVALSYIRRICPYALLEIHLLVSRSLYDDQGGIQGCVQMIGHKDTRLIKTKQRVNQDDQHTKCTRCTERDQVIPWYGKHCPLRICVLTHGLRKSSMWG